jgi:hypothetical protein
VAKFYYEVPIRNTGDYITETLWDRYIRDNINNLMIPPVYRGESPGVSYSWVNNVFVPLAPTTAVIDTDGIHPQSVLNESYPTFRTPGVYVIGLTGRIGRSSFVWNFRVDLYKRYLDNSSQAERLASFSDFVAESGEQDAASGGREHSMGSVAEFSVKDSIEGYFFASKTGAGASPVANFGSLVYTAVWGGNS